MRSRDGQFVFKTPAIEANRDETGRECALECASRLFTCRHRDALRLLGMSNVETFRRFARELRFTV